MVPLLVFDSLGTEHSQLAGMGVTQEYGEHFTVVCGRGGENTFEAQSGCCVADQLTGFKWSGEGFGREAYGGYCTLNREVGHLEICDSDGVDHSGQERLWPRSLAGGHAVKLGPTSCQRSRQIQGLDSGWIPSAPHQAGTSAGQRIPIGSGMAEEDAIDVRRSEFVQDSVEVGSRHGLKECGYTTTPSAKASMTATTDLKSPFWILSAGVSPSSRRFGESIQRLA